MKRWIGILIIGILFVTGCNKAPAIPNEPVATVAPSPTKMPEVTATPVSTQTPKPTATSGPEKEPSAGPSRIIAIDPGHQGSGDSTTEPNGPGSSTMKARVAGGTHGTTTGVYEYQLTLAISLQLQAELESRGYTVYLTRTSHDVNISNMERAQYASSVGGEIAVRIHANGSENASVNGAMALAPSASNPYIALSLIHI